ncbi:MAG TPA: SDR family NAD(P)-dependent oxidoreductase [Enteractinococcus sp.]
MNTSDRVILLTGATSGLGRAVAQTLAARGGRLILHGRNPARLEELLKEFAKTEAQIDVVQADLSDLQQVEQLAKEVAELTDHLDVLVHNAGVGKGATDARELSADGYELRLAVNHLAPFALTQRLLPLLEIGAPSRIVNVASGTQQPIDFSDPHLEHGYSGNRAYGQSKFAMVTAGFALAKILLADVVTVNSLHPATLMPTRMVKEGYGYTVDDLQTGVDAVVNLVENPALDGTTGQYFSIQQPAAAHREAYDVETQRRLWELSEELTGVRY